MMRKSPTGQTAATDPTAITCAMLKSALHKANDAVHADQIKEWDYAMQAYGDSCASLGRVMERMDQSTEEGRQHWHTMEGIRNSYIRRIHDIRDFHLPRTPRSRSANSRRSSSRSRTGQNSKRSSTGTARTPPRTPRQQATPPMTPPLPTGADRMVGMRG